MNSAENAYAYDALGDLVGTTDPLGNETACTYDESGNLLSETDALGNTIHYGYTQSGLLQKVIKADGQEIEICYNDAGSPVAVFADDGYTLTGGCNETGPVQLLRNSVGTVTYQYNMAGTLVSVENVNGDVVSYTYDAYGNKASVTYPDGRTVSYTYDLLGRMETVTDLNGDVTRYTYDGNGRRVQTASDTLTTDYTYDNVGNLIRQETGGESDTAFAYSYDRNGYITEETRMENGTTVTSSYAYNPMGELVSFKQSSGYGEQYSYDAVGNMLEKVITGTDGNSTAVNMAYNSANQLIEMVVGVDAIKYDYDTNGSMVKKVLNSAKYGILTDTYSYDALDQLTAYTGYDGYRQLYTYDANGMRATKSEAGNGTRSTLEELLRGDIAGLPAIVAPVQTEDVNADGTIPAEYAWATTEYLYDIAQEYYQVLMEAITDENDNAVSTAYTYGLERIAAYTGNVKTAYVYDGRGSVAHTITIPVAGEKVSSALPDVGAAVQSFVYTAFGEQMGRKVSGFGYNAEAFDAAPGMIDLRARQYEPILSRFSQKDRVSATLPTSLSHNKYIYTNNLPTIFTDPSGESLIMVAAVGKIAAVVGLASLALGTSTKIKKVSTALEYAKHVVEENDRQKQIGLAKEASEYYKANYDDLPHHVKSAYDEAQKALQYAKKVYKNNASKYKNAENSILVGLCKIIYGDKQNPDSSYNPSTIGNSRGSHYGSVPLSFQSAVAEKMQDEEAQYGKNGTSSIKYDATNNEWILDCWGSEAVNAYLWMDEDVYELYKYSSIQGPVHRIYEALDERGLTYNIEQNTGTSETDYWQRWLLDCESSKNVDVPVPGVKGFVEYGKDSQNGYDHIFEVLTPGTYNGVTYEHPIRTMANTKDDYQIVELYDYVVTLQRSGGYIASWGEQPGTVVEKEGYVEDTLYPIKHYDAVTTVGNLAVRGSYSKDSQKKDTLKKNVTVTILKEGYTDKNNEEWCQVRLQDGTMGYIMKKFLSAK